MIDFLKRNADTTVILPFVRHLLQFGAGYLTAKGIFDEATADTAIGVVMGIFSIGWYFASKYSVKAERAATAVDEGKTVVVAPQPAEVIKRDK